MSYSLNINEIVMRGMSERKAAISAAAELAVRAANEASDLAERQRLRVILAAKVRATAPAVAKSLLSADIPFTINTTRKYVEGFRMWSITRSTKPEIRYLEKPNPIYHNENARRGFGPRDGEPRTLKESYDIIVESGLALNQDGSVKAYVEEKGTLAQKLQVREATDNEIIPFSLTENTLDIESALSLWQGQFAQLFVPKDL